VEHAVLVAERNALEEVIHERASDVWAERATLAVGVHVLLQVLLAELEDEHELRLGVDDVVQADDVLVVELLHKRNLADRG
jgi:hypothetical protein